MDVGVSLLFAVLVFLRCRHRDGQYTALEAWDWGGRNLARQYDVWHWKVELVHVLLHPRLLRHPIRAPKTLAA